MNKYASDTRYITTKSLFEKILIDLAEGSVFLVVDKPTSPIFNFLEDKKDKFGGHYEIKRGLNTQFFQSAAEYLLASVKHPDYDYDVDEDDSQGVVTNLSIEDPVEKDKLILKKDYLSKNKTFEKITTKEIKKSYSKGSKDLEEIGLIQKALKELKFDIKEDKDFGIKTKKIIETFQESYKPTHKTHKDYTLGKKKDGIVGRNTLLALDEACVEGWEYEEKVEIKFDENTKSSDISDATKKILKKIGKKSKNKKIYISSTARDAYNQARVMYDNCNKIGGVQEQLKTYKPTGDKVVQVYIQAKKDNKNRDETIALMKAKIKELGETNVTKHATDTTENDVFDVSIRRLKNPKNFKKEAKDMKYFDKIIIEKKNTCYHFEKKL